MTPEQRRILGAKRSKVSHIIRYEMRVRGTNGALLAKDLDFSEATVSKTINGLLHSKPVLDALRALGIPEKYLFDPHRNSARRAGARKPERVTA